MVFTKIVQHHRMHIQLLALLVLSLYEHVIHLLLLNLSQEV